MGRTERAELLIYALPCVKYIAGKQLQYRQLSSCSTAAQRGRMGKGVRGREAGEGICILRTHSQCCIAETNTNVNQISSDHHNLRGKKNYHDPATQYRMGLTSPRENHSSKTHISTVHCSTIYNSQDMGSTRFSSTDEWIIRCAPYIEWNIVQ